MRYTKPHVVTKIDKRFKLSKYGYTYFIRINDVNEIEQLRWKHGLRYIIVDRYIGGTMTGAEMDVLYGENSDNKIIVNDDMLYAHDGHGYMVLFKNKEDAFMIRMGL